MVRKRYAELVVGMSKDAPQVLTHLDIVIGMGQHIPAKAECRKVITCFFKDTVSGRIGDGDSTPEKKQHNRRETPTYCGEKTIRTPLGESIKKDGHSSPT